MKTNFATVKKALGAAFAALSCVLVLSSSLSSCMSSAEPDGAKVPLPGKIIRSFGISTDPADGRIAAHPGIDIAAAPGTLVRAVGDGIVDETGENGLLGKYVILGHAKAKSVYAQLDEVLVTAGKSVKRGEPVGRSGSTGKTASPHLHFAVYVDGVPIDPTPYADLN